ncbi:cytochrome P450 [Bacillus mojavensis]|uniref:bifunctional cytochrome P450/NADPH--P450 reductase n=1 Tax=Bacillus mojavensis TaxID=72360 RepID=UPI002DB7A93E|nr:cytochrome P450 [Bacillus mojavensis]MEC1614903.1 cytochrome P450 [Bacillus mojavensis]MEC1690531.1 cytochrome P450 [Bacillus mojavensis]
MKETSPIPQPKTFGPLGNLPLIDKDKPTLSLIKLAEEQGPIFQIHTPAGTTIVVSGHEYVKEVCDEERFDKSIEGALEKVRAFSGDGLFTSWTHEPNWRKAHNILMPTFSQRAMKDYHEKMVDIAVQLIQKWARLNPNEAVDVPADMTRLTLDTIGLCGFNYRFNSYYRETPHPFINSMVRALDEAMHQMQRLDVQDKLMVRTKRQFHHDIQTMFSLVDSIIAERKADGDQDEKDLLARMLKVEDPETGEKLDDENIRFQIITFLIAGHETTSGLLSFAIYFLLKHPDKLKKAYEEVDRVLGMVLKYFTLIDHENYELDIKQTLTLKPGDFHIRVQTRNQEAIHAGVPSEEKAACDDEQKGKQEAKSASVIGLNNRPLLVLYGSDTGTAEGVARELADTASLHGVRTEVAPLNDQVGKLPKEGAVVIVTSSYNGKPPSNAGQFVQWLEEIQPSELEGVHYAVFGCGDHNWASTYQYVPRTIDEQLAEKGATRFSARGEGDASGDFEGQLDQWKKSMWSDAIKAFGLELNENADKERSTLSLQFVRGLGESPLARSYEAVHASIAENRELQSADSGRSTRHIEMALPAGVEYQEGDHLGVLPRNSRTNVSRILHSFGLKGTDQVTLTASGRSSGHLPLDRPVSLHDLLSYSVEVQEAATRAQIRELAAFTVCPPHKRELEDMTEEGVYQEQILKKRISMLDLLEQYESCEMPFERFLELLRPLKPRYYSISSSPRVNPEQAAITVGVVRGPAWSGSGEYRGVASNDLAERKAGDDIVMFVRTPESRFQLPDDPETPIIMVGPGTGVAPFRGFLQARSALKREGKTLGEAHLYFGCRNDRDYIYRDELKQFEQDGIVTVHTAFSRKEGIPKTYVQHLMAEHAETLISILDRGGRLYVCGDGTRMAPEVEAALQNAYQSVHGTSEEEAQGWLRHLQETGMYAKDVWSGI